MIYEIVLFLHVIGAFVLFGTGAGIAFFFVISNRSGNPAFIAHTAGTVVLADGIFTATAAVAQPISGYILTQLGAERRVDCAVFGIIRVCRAILASCRLDSNQTP